MSELCCVFGSVRREVVEGLDELVDVVMDRQPGAEDGDELWRLRASLVNKVPRLAARLEGVASVRGAGWVCRLELITIKSERKLKPMS